MNRKRLVRSWWLWGLLALFLIFVLPNLLSTGSGYHGVSTSDAISQITQGNVKKAIQSDKEQTLQLELKKSFEGKYTKIATQYPSDYSNAISTDLQKANVDFRTHVSKENT